MASPNPYDLLGVAKNASQKDIQLAFRKLAKKLHPDLHPGVKEAEQKFQQVSAAYDILGDPEKRARFDRGEIDASGAEQPQRRYYRDFAEADSSANTYEDATGFADFGDAEDILSSFFSRSARRGFRTRGPDRRYQLGIDFLDAVNGTTKRVTLPDGTSVDVAIPPGTEDGQVLRLRGQGGAAPGGGEAGDAFIEITVRPHPFFRRDGHDIRLNLPISLTEAVLGAKISVPTPTGPVILTVPEHSNTGKILRLRGKGVPGPNGQRGDEYLTLRIMLPSGSDPELEAFASHWTAGKSFNPRKGMGV